MIELMLAVVFTQLCNQKMSMYYVSAEHQAAADGEV